jgi:hypothetical protein
MVIPRCSGLGLWTGECTGAPDIYHTYPRRNRAKYHIEDDDCTKKGAALGGHQGWLEVAAGATPVAHAALYTLVK